MLWVRQVEFEALPLLAEGLEQVCKPVAVPGTPRRLLQALQAKSEEAHLLTLWHCRLAGSDPCVIYHVSQLGVLSDYPWATCQRSSPLQKGACSRCGTLPKQEILSKRSPVLACLANGSCWPGKSSRVTVPERKFLTKPSCTWSVKLSRHGTSLLSSSALSRSPCNNAPVGSICRANGTFHFPVVLDAPTPLKVPQVWETCKSCIPWFARMRSACNLHPFPWQVVFQPSSSIT